MSALEHDPNGLAANAPGAKLDAGKNRVWLCVAGFSRALDAVAQVTTAGAVKYSPNGWMHVDNGVERYMDAFGRHMVDLGKGKVFDDGPKGTGARHKAQMIWNLLASLELELRAEEEAPTVKDAKPAELDPKVVQEPLIDMLRKAREAHDREEGDRQAKRQAEHYRRNFIADREPTMAPRQWVDAALSGNFERLPDSCFALKKALRKTTVDDDHDIAAMNANKNMVRQGSSLKPADNTAPPIT